MKQFGSSHSLRVLFTGDVCFKNRPVEDGEGAAILGDLLPLFREADLRVMNLETPLAPKDAGAPIPKDGPNIIGEPQNVGFLRAAGCDAVSLANNHTGDFGSEPLAATLRTLDGAGIGYFGAGSDLDEAYRAWRTEKNGVRLSLLGVCEHEFGLAGENTPGTAAFDAARLAGAIKREREVSDFVIVMAHGGCEQCPVPTPRTRERYRLMLELGADAVIGGHPHCPQGAEWVHGKPIVYSTGNFLFHYDFARSAAWNTGYVVTLTLTPGKAPEMHLTPYRYSPENVRFSLFTGGDLAAVEQYLGELSRIAADPAETAKLFDGWCRYRGEGFLDELLSGPENAARLRNLLNCEAHAEVVARTAELRFLGVEDAGERARVLALQELPV